MSPETQTAWLFPGHGSQYVGMGRETLASSPVAREIFEAAEALSGLPLRDAMLRGPAELLGRPSLLEPALTALSLSHAAILGERGLLPDCVAGYSAGEVAALAVAGVLTPADALRLAVLRGVILERAAAGPAVRMVGVYGILASAVEEMVSTLRPRGLLALAGWNGHDHATVVGAPELVAEVERQARLRGAIALPVQASGAWHSHAVADAAREIWEASREIEFHPPRLPLFSAVTGRQEVDPARIRLRTAQQICRPVKWRQVTEELLRRGCTRFLELGPGGVLRGFLKRRADAPPLDVRCVERRGGALVTAVQTTIRGALFSGGARWAPLLSHE